MYTAICVLFVNAYFGFSFSHGKSLENLRRIMVDPPYASTNLVKQRKVLLLTFCAITFMMLGTTFGMFAFADRIIDLQSGFIICASDCGDFNNLSSFVLKNGLTYSFSGDYHTSYFYKGFILYLAGLKALFGDLWTIAFTAMNVLFSMLLALYAAQKFSPKNHSLWVFICFGLFVSFHLPLITYYRTLLADGPFALIGVGILIAAALSVEKRRWSGFAIVLVLASLATFVRPNGLFLFAIVAALAISQLMPPRWMMGVLTGLPILGGILAIFLSAMITVQAVDKLDKPDSHVEFVGRSMGQFLEFNYFGEDDLQNENRLGALLTNYPYKSWTMNDGTFKSIVASIFKRAPKVFEISMPPYSAVNNLTRYLWYVPIYCFALGFCIQAFRRKRIADIALIFSLVSYLLIFIAFSHVTLRFRLFFDIALALIAARYVGELIATFWPNKMVSSVRQK